MYVWPDCGDNKETWHSETLGSWRKEKYLATCTDSQSVRKGERAAKDLPSLLFLFLFLFLKTIFLSLISLHPKISRSSITTKIPIFSYFYSHSKQQTAKNLDCVFREKLLIGRTSFRHRDFGIASQVIQIWFFLLKFGVCFVRMFCSVWLLRKCRKGKGNCSFKM